MKLSLSHLAFDKGEVDAVWIATTDTVRIDWFVLKTELHLALVREFLHLFEHRVEHVTVESAVLDIFVLCDTFAVFAESEHSEEFFQVDIVDRTFTNLAPSTQIDIKSRRTWTTAKRGDSLQVAGVALAKVQNLASTLIHHRDFDDTFPALPTLVSNLLASSIYLRLWELDFVEHVLLHIILYTFVFVVTLIRHINMKQGFASCFQFVVFFGTDSQIAKRYLKVEEIARQVLWFE